MVYLILVIVGIFIWCLFGSFGFIYWWTREYDFKRDDIVNCIFIGSILGPLAWIAGYFIHGTDGGVIFKKKENK